MKRFDTGKLPPLVLDGLLRRINPTDPRVIVGPRIGEDAAVIDMGDRFLVAKTDPVTFTEDRIGWYGVHVNANDVATMGAAPRWFLATLLLPERRTDEALVETIFEDILSACHSLGVTLCGGHTEITTGLDRPVLVGQMLGEVEKDRLVRSDRMTSDDVIVLTRGIAIEGTAILAAEKGELLSRCMETSVIKQAQRFLDDPGISVVRAALSASEATRVHAMHDPTEGGLATGLWEMAQAGRCGLSIDGDAVPLFPETRMICDCLKLDPWGLIASGALLLAVGPDDVPTVTAAMQEAGIPSCVIGCAVPQNEGVTVRQHGANRDLTPFVRDEITKVL